MAYKTRAVLEMENEELRGALEAIYDRAAGALGAEEEDEEDALDDEEEDDVDEDDES